MDTRNDSKEANRRGTSFITTRMQIASDQSNKSQLNVTNTHSYEKFAIFPLSKTPVSTSMMFPYVEPTRRGPTLPLLTLLSDVNIPMGNNSDIPHTYFTVHPTCAIFHHSRMPDNGAATLTIIFKPPRSYFSTMGIYANPNRIGRKRCT